MLIEMRDYIAERGTVTLRDLSWRFRSDPQALRGMLDHWERKGLVRRSTLACATGGCAKACSACGLEQESELYEWAGPGDPGRTG